MTSLERQYRDYVEHPRFGRGPRFTDLHPDPKLERVRVSSWTSFSEDPGEGELNNGAGRAIDGTAVKGDVEAQPQNLFPFTHYYDVDRRCMACGKQFIFFAEEQKYWYEVLQLDGGANCHHCIVCRKELQHLRWWKKRYEELGRASDRTDLQTFEMVECGVKLLEAGVFATRSEDALRHAAKTLSKETLASERAIPIISRLWPHKGNPTEVAQSVPLLRSSTNSEKNPAEH